MAAIAATRLVHTVSDGAAPAPNGAMGSKHSQMIHEAHERELEELREQLRATSQELEVLKEEYAQREARFGLFLKNTIGAMSTHLEELNQSQIEALERANAASVVQASMLVQPSGKQRLRRAVSKAKVLMKRRPLADIVLAASASAGIEGPSLKSLSNKSKVQEASLPELQTIYVWFFYDFLRKNQLSNVI